MTTTHMAFFVLVFDFILTIVEYFSGFLIMFMARTAVITFVPRPRDLSFSFSLSRSLVGERGRGE